MFYWNSTLENPVLKDYLFLFLYSYYTRTERKNNMLFLFRFLFSRIWPKWIGDKGRAKIWDHLQKKEDINNDDLIEYFAKVHLSENSQKTRKQLQQMQGMDDSTYFDDFPIVHFEYRGFRRLLKEHSIKSKIFEKESIADPSAFAFKTMI